METVVTAEPEQRESSQQVSASASADEAQSSSQRVVRGSAWALFGYGVRQVLRLGSNIVLTRLLVPEYFGVMTLVNVFIQGLEMFSDIGIGASVIQNSRGDERQFRNTAWTFQVARGLIMGLVSVAIAWPIALIYGQPLLAQLLPVAGLTAVMSGFNSIDIHTLRRHLQLHRLAILEITSQLMAVCVMCSLAWHYPSVWALMSGPLTYGFVMMVLSYRLCDMPTNRFCWDRECRVQIFRFGKWIFLSTALTFCAIQIDRILLGTLIPMSLLGVYGVAFAIGSLPAALLGSLEGSVMFPVLSRAADQSREVLQHQLMVARGVLLGVGLLMITSVFCTSELFFRSLYNYDFHYAGFLAKQMVPWIWVLVMSNSLIPATLAIGDSRSLAAHNLVKLVATATFCYLGFQIAELSGFMIGLAIGAVAGHVVLQFALYLHGISIFRQDLGFSLSLVVLCGVAQIIEEIVAAYKVRFPISILGETIGLQFFITPLICVPLAWWSLRRLRLLKLLKDDRASAAAV